MCSTHYLIFLGLIRAGSICVVYSILEIWSYNSTHIRSLTQDQIISDINSVTTSPVYGNAIDVSTYLGTTTTNSSGSVTSAQAAVMTWLTVDDDEMEANTESWEDEFINLGLAGHSDITTVYVMARKSFREEARKAAFSDAILLIGGHFVVVVFVVTVLGNFNFMEQKMWLTVAGFISIGFAELVSISISSAVGQAYGPIQSVLPFLLLGLGVDDMFVIIRALNCLSPEEQALDIPHKMAAVLRHAGVSITVTSLTDFVAFIIGATTVIPALRSFCIYAAFGIATLYVLQAIFFTSFLTFDLRRLQKRRDACLFCCVTHPSPPYTPNECSKKQMVPFIFKHGLAQIITKFPVKIVVVLVSLGLLSVNIYGVVHLEQFFDRNWLLNDGSYAKNFITAMDKHFPDSGLTGYVFCGNVDYWGRQTEFEALGTAMDSSSVIYDSSTDSWFSALTSWLSSTTDTDVIALLDANKYPVSEEAFMNLTYKLTTEIATRTNGYIVFSSTSGLDITVIQQELYRNVGLAMIAVFIVTLLLIANMRTSLWVFFTVVSTLVDVAGTMYYWGLTIDMVTSVILITSVGLSVDYSAHIGHAFMTVSGTRQERIRHTIEEMGPAVFYGGFSTFLAFSLLTISDSYVFRTFFELNFLVVLYGLFNGLVLLPVLLSWFGSLPQALPDDDGDGGTPDKTDSPGGELSLVKDQGLGHVVIVDNTKGVETNGLGINKEKHSLGVISLEDDRGLPSPSSLPEYTSRQASTVDITPVQS
ncbi:patched domain-containing protein [Elysia marginata]|uniref:Patched domain-containing protein n=1 Tax=Elysia marginata TaxID=1093978 RepID=A0AAV4H5U9_9GAST|nr:patched domain-containing protein [Elysia marginata]